MLTVQLTIDAKTWRHTDGILGWIPNRLSSRRHSRDCLSYMYCTYMAGSVHAGSCQANGPSSRWIRSHKNSKSNWLIHKLDAKQHEWVMGRGPFSFYLICTLSTIWRHFALVGKMERNCSPHSALRMHALLLLSKDWMLWLWTEWASLSATHDVDMPWM